MAVISSNIACFPSLLNFPSGALVRQIFGLFVLSSVSLVCAVLSCYSHIWLFATHWTSPPGSSVPGILQAEFCRFCPCRFCRILGWVAMLSSKESSNPGIESVSLIPPDLGGRFFTISTIWETISLSLFLIFFSFCCFLCDFFHNLFQFTNSAFSSV